MQLPEARPVLWPLRPAESARSSIATVDGRVVITVEHAPLRGVTGEMLTWWFAHVRGDMEYADAQYPRYLVWHPLDHISYEVVRLNSLGRVGPGAQLHIVEALGRDPQNVIDIQVAVEELEAGRAVIAKWALGTHMVRLENEFEDGSGGARYLSRMSIGDQTPLGRLFLNRVARNKAFPAKRIRPWIRHHVEEIGNLEHFLPDLFEVQAVSET